MRIGIDGGCLANRRGFGRFARRLVEALAQEGGGHDYVVFVDSPSSTEVVLPEPFERVVVEVGVAPTKAASARGKRKLGDMLAMGRAVAGAGLDLMFFPATYSYFPTWNTGKLVVTMHDALPLVYPELVFPTRSGRLAWRLKESVAGWAADRIVTVSQASRQALVSHAGWSDSKIRVITEGPDPVFTPKGDDPRAVAVLDRLGLSRGERFLLFVGGPSPHKNLPRLIEAFGRIKDLAPRLVIVGDLDDIFHSQVPEIRAAIKASPGRDRITLAGFVPDDELVFLYSRAYALVLPSLLEGFGLPAVEAMACGTPVLASRAGSLPEVVGPAGDLFDPTNAQDMADCIALLLANPDRRDRLAKIALEQARQFTWQRSARALVACFEELAGEAIAASVSA